MFNNIDWTRSGNDGICISNSENGKEYAKRFSQGNWTFLGLGEEKMWYGTLSYTLEGKWDSTATQMVERFKDTGHPVFKRISALRQINSEKEEWQRHSTFQRGCFEHRVLFQIIHSVNQSNIYRAVTNWCEHIGLPDEGQGQKKLKNP